VGTARVPPPWPGGADDALQDESIYHSNDIFLLIHQIFQ
jgi:hypothetical protein